MKRDRAYHNRNAEDFLAKLSKEQKLLVISGTGDEREVAGLPRFEVFGEAAHGVQARHDQIFDLGEPACTTVFQNPIGFAATWDKELMHEVGSLVGTEARSLYQEGKNRAICMFAPTIDMERDPRWGRNEEAYGEDPHLTSRIAGEYIKGMAGDDPRFVRCGATLKHFYGNNVEEDRCCADSNISEKLKDSYYIHVFEEIIDYADPQGAMSSYNLVNGVPNTFNPEMTTRLKKRGLPFVTGDGGVIDLAVTRQKAAADMTEAVAKAAKAGMDSFLDDSVIVRNGLEDALGKGMLTEEDIDRIAFNRLLSYLMLGLLEEDIEKIFSKELYNSSKVDTAENRALARKASAEAAVLLKNEDSALPLKEGENIKLLGPFADRCPMDWYSGLTSHQVTIREGLQEISDSLCPYVYIKLGEGLYAGLDGERLVAVPKDKAELFRIMLWDETRITLRSVSLDLLLTSQKPDQLISSQQPEEAEHNKTENSAEQPDAEHKQLENSAEQVDEGNKQVDNRNNSAQLAGDVELFAYKKDAFGWFVLEAFQLLDEKGEVIRFKADDALHFWEDKRIRGMKNHDIKMPVAFETVKNVEEILANILGDGDRIIAAFGLHPIVNAKEDVDRESIEFPPFQRAVIRKLREASSDIILILNANAPVAAVEENEAEEIRSILWMAGGNEEYGNSIADIIYGRVSPAGRLPQTWYRGDEQLADKNDYDIEKTKMTYLYMEDDPLYRFGYGLSYTDFSVEIISCSTPADKTAAAPTLTVHVKNTGDTSSDYVVEIYKRPDGSYRLFEDISEPGARLSAFTRLKDIAPGEERIVTLNCRY